MHRVCSVILLFVFVILPSRVEAQYELKFADIGDLQLINGGVIPHCTLGYRTVGVQNNDSSNVVLFLTWFSGNSNSLTGLCGPGKLIDSSKYFIICIDALGNGISTSPSNYQDAGTFPRITITDMVNSQYKLAVEHFKLKKVYAVFGGSMGSMQALEWAAAYPDFIEKVIAYSCTPKLTSYDLLWMNWIGGIIEDGMQCGFDASRINKNIQILNQLFAQTPEYIVKSIGTDTFDVFFSRLQKEPSKTFTLQNYLAQLRAMIGHNIYRKYGGSVKETVRNLRAKMLLIVNATDILIRPEPAYELAKESGCEILTLQNDRGHYGAGYELKKCGETINRFLEKTE